MVEQLNLTIALPSGKSLEAKTLEVFEKANITIRRPHARSCMATVTGLPGIARACFAKPSSIPGLVAKNHVAFGITGNDTVFEFSGENSRSDPVGPAPIKTFAKLAYSRATERPTKCVVFTHQSNPVDSVENMEQNATIATEYPLSTAKLLFRHGIRATLHGCSGSAETYVALGVFKYGVSLVETGETLRANGLKIIGTAFESSTVLIGNAELLRKKDVADIASFLGSVLTGVLDARRRVYLTMNAKKSGLGEIKNRLPSLKSPTIQQLSDPNFVSVSTVVERDQVNNLMFELSKCGASDFVVLPPTTIV